MGRVGARLTRVQVSSPLTWTFSARLGTGPPPGSRHSVLPPPGLPRRHRHG
ncbi:hypothetical protein GT030_31660 [Streptomyces sp. SID1328]|uniref:hypothetical protein n=1 Tax=Streptomyces sp. SID1328 TaxID=2690250 RepID=UPI0013684997|nr:hypothetical protein [Streptomyces sp. SID1328]MYV43287.1 hypothetical protein [Streptomyces sp. SID1328]